MERKNQLYLCESFSRKLIILNKAMVIIFEMFYTKNEFCEQNKIGYRLPIVKWEAL